ncbi:metallophosphoesterase [Falsiporphyromonas endometrii]|uniref:Metallophosphoesterase n=1 Tax=Falsiporphyromonas endometrii TaxID=1387297 RepID=A0ABV9K6Q9_9PORP
MKVFLQALVGQILFNLYIGRRGGQALSHHKIAKWTLYALLIVEFSIYLVGFCFHRSLHLGLQEEIMQICSTWFIISIYLTMGLMLIDGIRLIDHFTGRRIPRWSEVTKERIKLLLVGAFIVVAVFLGWLGYHTVSNPVVTYQTIYLNKPIDNQSNRLRVVLLTDIHMSESITKNYIERMVNLVNDQHPDLILVGGDMFDFYSWYGYKDNIPALYKSMKAPLGVYYVMGNHEYRADTQRKKDWVSIVGGTLLIDSVVSPGNVINLIGRDDYTNYRTRAPLKELVDRIPKSHKQLPVVLLEHQPRYLDSLQINNIDLGLYGHTHDGQIFPFAYAVKITFEKAYGYLRKGKSQIYVSSGFGAAGPAMRIFTKSEVVVIDLLGRS